MSPEKLFVTGVPEAAVLVDQRPYRKYAGRHWSFPCQIAGHV